MHSPSDIIIIGAGPAGLATAARLREAGIPFRMLEKSNQVANRWHDHYDRVCLHTVKKWSHLPLLPFPDDYPTYVPKNDLIRYFEAYATHFDIQPECNTEVDWISRSGDGHWSVNTNKGEYLAAHVVVATGLNKAPNIPEWKGRADYGGEIIHSISYRDPAPFQGKEVLVVGMGNTGAEIALDLAENGIRTWLSVRSPVNIVPRDLNGRPVQVTSRLLAKLPFNIGDWIGGKVQRLYFGNLKKYGLEQSKMYPAEMLRKTGKTPVIDVGTVAAIKAGKIRVVGDIMNLTKDGVAVQNGETIPASAIIAATGYRHMLEDLIDHVSVFLDPGGYPKGAVATGFHEGIYFVGFDNYKLGGILGTIFTDSEMVARAILKRSG